MTVDFRGPAEGWGVPLGVSVRYRGAAMLLLRDTGASLVLPLWEFLICRVDASAVCAGLEASTADGFMIS